MNEVERLKARYAKQIEDGKKITVFMGVPEWEWYVNEVLQPTIDEYTKRVMQCEIESNKEDAYMRGMVAGIKLVIETPDLFITAALDAKQKAKEIGAVDG